MKFFLTLLTPFLFLACMAEAQPNIDLVNYATGFSRPVDIANSGDDRLFIVEQHTGRIRIIDGTGNVLSQPFIDLPPVSTGNEQGLLGMAFHPDYANNGYFYVNYTRTNAATRISRFKVSDTDPNIADLSSELILLEVAQPFSNHNGGCLKFGPDGYLYIGLGDGGSGGDPQANGQKKTTLLGKMLRIDVNSGSLYGIPPNNPFVNETGTLKEIWAYGLRNPWRFSFDRVTGDMWIGDVGQDAWEEVDFQPAASTGGENYGWRCYEGNNTYNTGNCPPANTLIFPVAVYQNTNAIGCSITGGFVYRGCNFPELYGHYLYTDYCTGRVWSIKPDGAGGWTNVELANLNDFQFVSFGENNKGELFLAGLGNGIIYRVTETTTAWGYTTSSTKVSCPGSDDGSITISFSAATPATTVTWADGATGEIRENLAEGTYTATIAFPNGCTSVETFEITSSLEYTAIQTNETCPGDADGSIALDITGGVEPVKVAWEDGSSNPVRSSLGTGTYSVTITGDEGCTVTGTFTISSEFETPPTPAITISQGTVLSAPSGFAGYMWFLDGNLINGAVSATYTAKESGAYTVEVTNDGGCSALSVPVNVTVTSARELPGIEQLKVTPNPFSNSLRIQLTALQPFQLEISINDVQGRQVFQQTASVSGGFDKTLNLQSLPAGVYMLVLKTEKGERVERIVKR